MAWLFSNFGSKEYEQENILLTRKNLDLLKTKEELEKELANQKNVNHSLAAEFVRLEADLHQMRIEPDQYIEMEVERRMIEFEKQHEDDMNHKWYAQGRKDAYAEMGIKVIEAHERGNDIVYDIENDAFIEEIDEEKLNDIWDELENEITIDDLVEV